MPLLSNEEQQKKEALYTELLQLVSLKRKTNCEKDFQLFVNAYLSHLTPAKSPEFHKEMISLLNQANSQPRLLFIAPRGFAKSTVCSIFFPLWLALFGHRKDIFLVSATISLAREMLRKIRNEIENNGYINYDFGDLRSDKWTEELLTLRNGTIIRAKGRGFQIRGFRPDMIICDDLEDEEVIYSKEQRDKMEQWFFRTLLPALKPDQNLVYVGTKIHQFSLINKLQTKEEFNARFWKALIVDPVSGQQRSIWEELWSTERLLKIRNEIGTYAFESEYQNNPLSQEQQPIKPHHLDGVRATGDRLFRCLALDPAISEKTSADYSAITVFDRLEDGFKEVYSVRERLGIHDLCDAVIDLYSKYSPDRIVIEEVAFQKVIRPVLMHRARSKGIYLPISQATLGLAEGKRPRDKFTRLMGVVHLFEQRLVEVRSPDLYQELLAFPHGEHDDLVDATVYALQWLKDFRSGAAKVMKEPQGLPFKTRDSFYVKEVRPGVFETRVDSIGPPPPRVGPRIIKLI